MIKFGVMLVALIGYWVWTQHGDKIRNRLGHNRLTDGEWHQVFVNYDGGQLKSIYVDGHLTKRWLEKLWIRRTVRPLTNTTSYSYSFRR